MSNSDYVVDRLKEASKEFNEALTDFIDEYNNCTAMSLKMERVIHDLVKELDKKDT